MWGEDCLLRKGVPRTYPTRRVQDGSERRTIEGDSPVARASAKGGAAWQGNAQSASSVAWECSVKVGGPLAALEVRLERIEDYDDPNCGEILLSGQCLTTGYLHDPEATEALFFDKDRKWIRTGDVGCWDKDGYLKVVDRLRSIFKLAQGEYVAADQITQIYESCPHINQIFVYGDSGKRFLVGIVCPKRREAGEIVGKASLTDEEFADACNNENLKRVILQEMNQAAEDRNLYGFQRVQSIRLVPAEWTTENDLLTPTFKQKRKKLADKYAAEIADLYRELAEKERAGTR